MRCVQPGRPPSCRNRSGRSVADEPAPPIGAVVDVDGSRFVVDGVGRSPLPGDRRECAFLVPSRSALPPMSEGVTLDVADRQGNRIEVGSAEVPANRR